MAHVREFGGGMSGFCTEVNSLYSELENPLGKNGDLDRRSNKSKKLRFLCAFQGSQFEGDGRNMMVSKDAFEQCQTKMTRIYEIYANQPGTHGHSPTDRPKPETVLRLARLRRVPPTAKRAKM